MANEEGQESTFELFKELRHFFENDVGVVGRRRKIRRSGDKQITI